MAVPFVESSANWLADRAFAITLWINRNILGMNITTVPGNTMYFSNSYGLNINSSCSGLKQFYQVFVLFILFPGPWKHKTWFIPFSLAIMFLTNIFRTVTLSIIMSFRPAYFEFSHDWLLRPFFYVVLFGLWVIWVEKYRK
jgi:exosortase/archaeosortase family protein